MHPGEVTNRWHPLIGLALFTALLLAGPGRAAAADLEGPKPPGQEGRNVLNGGRQDCEGDPANLLYPLDGTYVLVDFYGDGCTGSGCAEGSDQHNDDDSATVDLPFTFDMYGDLYTTCYVNNNGNISFGTYYSTFTATGFPDDEYIMIAPFWGDVDTGNPANYIGDVWMKFFDSNGDTSDDTLVVTWDNVGYYNEHGDLRNTFQVAISDGTNPVMGLGNNVCFSYDNMCWTTGDASGGSGGFGGTPATVGVNRGNGVDFFQIGRFDQPGDAYDGPYGDNDGIDYLDDNGFCFSTATELPNIDPIPVNFPPGNSITIDACAGEVLDLDLQFLSPEDGQTTTVVIDDLDGAQAAGLSIVNIPGNVASIELDWSPDPGDVGIYVLHFTATDDFNPPGVTEIDLTIEVICDEEEGDCTLPGRPAMDGTDDRVLRGYLVAFAVNSDGEEIKWNHLAGNTTIVNYRDGFAWEYAAWASQAVNPVVAHGDPTGFPGELQLNELEFAPPYSRLLMNFQAVDSAAFSQEGVAQVISDTDLTLHPVTIDLRQEHEPPVSTKASMTVWNQWEAQFSGAHRCITCWDQTLLSFYDSPNHFFIEFLQTDHGKARIEGEAAAAECPESVDAALLGVSARHLVFDGGSEYAAAGMNLLGMGKEEAEILYDVEGPPPPLPGHGTDPRALDGQTPITATAHHVPPMGGREDPWQDRATATEKGSILIFSKIELRWTADGQLVQDAFVQLTNDYPEDVLVQMYFIHGDEPLDADQFGCPHPGWNWVDVQIPLTADQPTFWSSLTGLPAGVSPFTVLDPGQ
ncbi:MAG: hypothetical protein SYC29_02900 [Planctomycetota bacterium]|nr:hypothetical protein [Planctomycetota bacterium]